MNGISPIIRIIITLCFMALLVALSVVPGHTQPNDSVFIRIIGKTPKLLQKILHFCLYGVLTLLWVWALNAIQTKTHRVVIAVTVAVLFGAVLEWYQKRVRGRFGTIFDVALNAAGALLGLLGAIFFL